jgi:HCNGP-like protein
MNGRGTGAYRNVSIEDDPESDDPPALPTAPPPAVPQPEPYQVSSPPTKVQSPPPSAAPEVIDVETPQSEEPEYLNPLAYTNTLIRQATLPNLPPDLDDFGIPPSPPGSPDTSLSQKLDTFRRLRERGLFFNDRLGENKGFRNPRLLEKLRGYVGIEDQYGSNLPASVWDPHAFKEEQFYDKLGMSVLTSMINGSRETEARIRGVTGTTIERATICNRVYVFFKCALQKVGCGESYGRT